MDRQEKQSRRIRLTSFQMIILGFFALILLGSFLLMLPVSARARQWTPFPDALFTAVSATCVTGLVVRDTATYWSMFGQFVLLLLIQIGGMGVITVALAIMRASGKKIGLWQRSTMQDSISALQVGGIVRLTGFILKMSGIIELCGMVLLCPVFCRDFGFFKGLWYALFHAVSAFCNAGFDLMGVRIPFSSLTTYSTNAYLNGIIMLLIVVGGIGFLTWHDVATHRFRLQRYSLQSKLALLTSLVLIVLPTVCFYFTEFQTLDSGERFLGALFQSVTARTAGFNTQALDAMSETGKTLMIVLMLIGGSPGSTAGGMKTVTVAVLLFAVVTVCSRRSDVQCLRRRIADETVRNAGALLFLYLSLFLLSGAVISRVENLPLLTCLFETGSAIGTVGVTLGITTGLSLFSKAVLMILMFFGRVGWLTLIYAVMPSGDRQHARLPLEKISVG